MKTKLWAGLTLVFILGLLAGAFGTIYYYNYRMDRFSKYAHPARKHILLRKLSQELNLSEEQKAEIEKIFEQYKTKIDDVRAVYLPEVRKLSDQMIKDIMKHLDSEQKSRMERIKKRIKHWGRRKRGRSPATLPAPDRIMNEIRERLELTDKQESEVFTILNEAYKEMEELLQKYSGRDPSNRLERRRELRRLRRSTDHRLGGVLTKEQFRIYMEVVEELRREKRNAMESRSSRQGSR
ncbi:hypothetical protein ACFL2O_08675 [Thermodesulfobacteriota bacterium]